MCDGPDVYLEEYICKNAKCDGKGIMIPVRGLVLEKRQLNTSGR
jgi:hypothetical protein